MSKNPDIFCPADVSGLCPGSVFLLKLCFATAFISLFQGLKCRCHYNFMVDKTRQEEPKHPEKPVYQGSDYRQGWSFKIKLVDSLPNKSLSLSRFRFLLKESSDWV